jgi:hypothetical protein
MVRFRHSLVLRWLALGFLAWVWALSARAQVLPDALEVPIPVPRGTPHPAWVKPGVRLTYYSAISFTNFGEEYYYRDDLGEWVDTQGRRYSKKEAGGPNEHGAAGHGYTQVTVVSTDRAASVLEVRAFNFSSYTGPPVVINAGAVVAAPGTGGDWWIHPQVLRQIPDSQGDGVRIIRMPYKLKNRVYQAIRFQCDGTRVSGDQWVDIGGGVIDPTRKKSRHVYVYDLASGVLIHTNHAVNTRDGLMLSHASFEGMRTVKVPWAGARVPDSIGRLASVDYSTLQLIPTAGGPPATRSGWGRLSMLGRGPDWVLHKLGVDLGTVGNMPAAGNLGEIRGVSGSVQYGGIWVPPQALALLQPGQVLDQDPLTQFEVRVENVAGDHVVLAEVGKLQRTDFTYDRTTGLLMGWSHSDPTLLGPLTLRLQYTGRKEGAIPVLSTGAATTAPRPTQQPTQQPLQDERNAPQQRRPLVDLPAGRGPG